MTLITKRPNVSRLASYAILQTRFIKALRVCGVRVRTKTIEQEFERIMQAGAIGHRAHALLNILGHELEVLDSLGVLITSPHIAEVSIVLKRCAKGHIPFTGALHAAQRATFMMGVTMKASEMLAIAVGERITATYHWKNGLMRKDVAITDLHYLADIDLSFLTLSEDWALTVLSDEIRRHEHLPLCVLQDACSLFFSHIGARERLFLTPHFNGNTITLGQVTESWPGRSQKVLHMLRNQLFTSLNAKSTDKVIE